MSFSFSFFRLFSLSRHLLKTSYLSRLAEANVFASFGLKQTAIT